MLACGSKSFGEDAHGSGEAKNRCIEECCCFFGSSVKPFLARIVACLKKHSKVVAAVCTRVQVPS